MKYTVWVGGSEVNDYYLDTLNKAQEIARHWTVKGYDQVTIEEITE